MTDSFLEAAYSLTKETGRKLWKAIHLLVRKREAPGLNLEKLRGKGSGLWSFRVDDKYRAIVHIDQSVTMLLFVGTHAEAYSFAERSSRRALLDLPQRIPEEPAITKTTPRVEQSKKPISKYFPLARHLLNLPPSEGNITYSFAELEHLLGAQLPPAARRYRPWWANTHSHVQAYAWYSVGWKVAKVSLSHEAVTFERYDGR